MIKGAHLLVATPGRLFDLIERRLVKLDEISILILDEADRMLDMGFKPQVDRIVRHLNSERQTMLFSATLDGEVGELARSYTRNPGRFEADPPHSAAAGTTEHRFVSVSQDGKVDALIAELENERGLALVFVRTKRGPTVWWRSLSVETFPRSRCTETCPRVRASGRWARFHAGKVNTLVATDVAARGLDLADITHVINFDPPEDDKGCNHRVGRTGRAGRDGSGDTRDPGPAG